MPGTRPFLISAALLAALAGASAQAAFITVDADDYSAGSNLSAANPFVSLSTFRKAADTADSPTFGSVFASDCYRVGHGCAATTGTRVFGDGFGGIDQWGAIGGSIGNAVNCFQQLGTLAPGPLCSGYESQFNVMLMTFAEATDSVRLSGGYFAQDETYLYGFDESFNLVGSMSHTFDFGSCAGSPTAYCKTTVSLTAASTDIRYVLAGGWSNGTSLDNLVFNVDDASVRVPEPGTFAMLAFGLGCAALSRRRKAHAAR